MTHMAVYVCRLSGPRLQVPQVQAGAGALLPPAPLWTMVPGNVQHSAVPALGTARSRAGGELGGAIGAWSCQLRSEPQPVLEPASVIAHVYTYTGG